MSKPDKKESAPAASAEPITMSAEDAELLREGARRALDAEKERDSALAAEKKVREQLELSARRVRELEEASAADKHQAALRAREQEKQLLGQTERIDALTSDNQRLHEEFASIRERLTKALAGDADGAREQDPLRPGHRRVITTQAYSFVDRGSTKTVPRGTVLQVEEVDYQNDKLRRFPHLQDHQEHLAREREKAEREAAPVQHGRNALEQILAQVEQVQKLRAIQRAETISMIQRPENIEARLNQ